MTRVETTPSESLWPNPTALGLAWAELFQNGSAAWTDACAQFARGLIETGAAQARMFAEITARPMASPWLADADGPLRAELLFVGEQAERTVDAVRQTLADLRVADREAPFVLPE